MSDTPRLSIVIVAYDMAREIPRTLRSFSAEYQRGVSADDYEVIVVDNGSPEPIAKAAVRAYGPNFSLHRIEDAAPSPIAAINRGVELSRGAVTGLFLDGARLVTPGMLRLATLAFRAFDDPTVATAAWHLGPGPQQDTAREGYNAEEEDRLLASIGWPADGHRLFEIAALGGSSVDGWFLPLAESNGIFLKRGTFDALGGYDEAFDLPGGGLANVDFYKRACERPGCGTPEAPLVMLLGEGTFHQLHGGVSTNLPRAESDRLYVDWAAQYERIRGVPWERARTEPVFLGGVPPAALPALAFSADAARERQDRPAEPT